MSIDIVQQSELFDYSSLDTETRLTVRQRTTEIRSLCRVAGQAVIDIGQKLLEVRDSLGSTGLFLLWLRDEFEWSYPTAVRYMAVAEATEGVNLSQASISNSALYLLSSNFVPENFRKEFLDRAQKGETITHRKVDEALKEKGLRAGFKKSLKHAPSQSSALPFSGSEVPTNSLSKVKPDKAAYFSDSFRTEQPEQERDEEPDHEPASIVVGADKASLPPYLSDRQYKLYEQHGKWWCARPGQSTAPQPTEQAAICDAVALETLLDDGWTLTQQAFYCATKGSLRTPGFPFADVQLIAIAAIELQKGSP